MRRGRVGPHLGKATIHVVPKRFRPDRALPCPWESTPGPGHHGRRVPTTGHGVRPTTSRRADR